MNTPANLLILDVGGEYEIEVNEELFDKPSSQEALADEIFIISGTITVSP